jgi:vacuolar-type H+-ATPase subunit H
VKMMTQHEQHQQLQQPCAWEVTIQPYPRSPTKPVLHDRPTVSPDVAMQRVGSAEIRRNQRLEERRRRSRELVEKAKTVAANHAKRVSEEVSKLREEIFRKQTEAESRRQQVLLLHHQNKQVCSTTLMSNAKTNEDAEVKSLKASFRACQRLACVVAKRKLHNAHAKLLALRVRSAKALQRLWRKNKSLADLCQRNQPCFQFFLRTLPMDAAFEQVSQFLEEPKAKAATSLLVKVVEEEDEKRKLLLLSQMIIRHPKEILSLPLEKRNVLVFASRRLLKKAETLVLRDDWRIWTTHRLVRTFRSSLASYSVLFKDLKNQDAIYLAEELFPTAVEIRYLFETESESSGEKQALEKNFFDVLGKVKRLLRTDDYKRFIARISREVKRRKEAANLARNLAMDPSYLAMDPSYRLPRTDSAPKTPKVDELSIRELGRLVVQTVADMKQRLKALTPRRTDLHREMDSHLDCDLLSQQVENRAFDIPKDFPKLIGYLKSCLERLAEKDQVDRLNEWFTRTFTATFAATRENVVTSFDFLLKELSQTEHQVAQFYTSLLEPHMLKGKFQGINLAKAHAATTWAKSHSSTEEVMSEREQMERVVPDVLAKVCTREIPMPDQTVLDELESETLSKLRRNASEILTETRNQILLKQVLMAHQYPTHVIKNAEAARCGLSVEQVVESARTVTDGKLTMETETALVRLLTQRNPLVGILERRLSSILQRYQTDRTVPDERMLQSLGMNLSGERVGELCKLFSRFVLVFVESRLPVVG